MTVLVYLHSRRVLQDSFHLAGCVRRAWREEASGSCIWMYMYPWSSSGRKLDGSTLPKKTAGDSKTRERHHGHETLANQTAGHAHVEIACPCRTCG